MTQARADGPGGADDAHGVTFPEALRVWLRVAALSFGGPAGQIAVMHRIVVDEKRWLSNARFLHALNYCMLLPGPEAQQLATYIGWLMHRTAGGLAAGLLFIAPGVAEELNTTALSMIYAAWGNVGIIGAVLFFGLKAAVLAIVFEAVQRIGRRALRNTAMVALAAAAFLAIFFFAVPFPLVVFAAGAIGYAGTRAGRSEFSGGGHGGGHDGNHDAAVDDSLLGDRVPAHAHPDAGHALRVIALGLAAWLLPVALIVALLERANVFSTIATYFSELAVLTFGGAYAVLAWVAQAAVQTYGWLTPGEMLNGRAWRRRRPARSSWCCNTWASWPRPRPRRAAADAGGSARRTAGDMGHLRAVFPVDFSRRPSIERLRANRALSGALAAITAAVVGVILNLAIWFAVHFLFRQTVRIEHAPLRFDAPVLASADAAAIMLAAAAMIAMFGVSGRRIGTPLTLALCGAAGAALYLAGWR